MYEDSCYESLHMGSLMEVHRTALPSCVHVVSYTHYNFQNHVCQTKCPVKSGHMIGYRVGVLGVSSMYLDYLDTGAAQSALLPIIIFPKNGQRGQLVKKVRKMCHFELMIVSSRYPETCLRSVTLHLFVI